ncbi:MAG: hypothetical protein FWG63_08770 [Defluviitaleaceae bacterium]|nr:hypothetical protein [Defluviitaleaceae bacterium]
MVQFEALMQFLQGNVSQIIGTVAAMCFIQAINIWESKNRIHKKLDEKRVAKGLPATTDEEKQLIVQTIRGHLILTAIITVLLLIVTMGWVIVMVIDQVVS